MRHIPLFIEFTFNNQLFQLPRLMNKPEDATTLCMCMCNALVYHVIQLQRASPV